ncbi:MAG: Glutathione transport system permease protein GsiC [Myxococcota bacterium]|nr:Glutathione transport system permease protein GsiC [Myxococcota bacterium]
MTAFLARKLGGALFVALGATLVVSMLLNLIPGDPIAMLLGEQSLTVDREALRRSLWLDLPWTEQYLLFVRHFAAGTLPSISRPGVSVNALLAERIPNTLLLALGAMSAASLFAIPLGVLAARRRNGWLDHSAMAFSLAGVSMPPFWLGPLLVLVFSIGLGWLPVSGLEDGARSLVLPSLTLGMGMAAILSRMTRSSIGEVLGEDYLRTARAKGASEARVLWIHAFRNALIPVLTVMGLQFGALLSGAVITERVFNWPGMGNLLVDAIAARDIRLVQGCVLAISLGYVLVNTLVDILYGLADPRVRGG